MAALEIISDRSTDAEVFFKGKFKGQVLEFLKVSGCHRSSVDWVTWFNSCPAVVSLCMPIICSHQIDNLFQFSGTEEEMEHFNQRICDSARNRMHAIKTKSGGGRRLQITDFFVFSLSRREMVAREFVAREAASVKKMVSAMKTERAALVKVST